MSTNLSPEKAALHRAAAVLGGQAAMASLLGYEDRRNVWPWFNTDRRFPAEHCPKVERATRERGDVVLCEELRPDVAWDVLRLQAGTWDGTERRNAVVVGWLVFGCCCPEFDSKPAMHNAPKSRATESSVSAPGTCLRAFGRVFSSVKGAA